MTRNFFVTLRRAREGGRERERGRERAFQVVFVNDGKFEDLSFHRVSFDQPRFAVFELEHLVTVVVRLSQQAEGLSTFKKEINVKSTSIVLSRMSLELEKQRYRCERTIATRTKVVRVCRENFRKRSSQRIFARIGERSKR